MSASREPLRLGLVGCGRIAEVAHVPALARVPDLDLVAVADHDRARRERIAARAGGVSCHESLARLLDGSSLDALVLATPAPAHLLDARLAAARGIPTLVEKPPASDAISAVALARLTPTPWIGFNRRFDPGVERLRDALEQAEVVELRLALSYRRVSWRPHEAADDALLDLCPHLVDLVRLLSGSQVTAVRCRDARATRAVLELELERGRAVLRCATDRPWRERFEARDGRGRPIAGHSLGGFRGLANGSLSRLAVGRRADDGGGGGPLVESIARELASFARAVRGKPAPELATAADGAAVMAVIDAARRSADDGGRAERPAAPETGVTPGGEEPGTHPAGARRATRPPAIAE